MPQPDHHHLNTTSPGVVFVPYALEYTPDPYEAELFVYDTLIGNITIHAPYCSKPPPGYAPEGSVGLKIKFALTMGSGNNHKVYLDPIYRFPGHTHDWQSGKRVVVAFTFDGTNWIWTSGTTSVPCDP